MESEDEKIIRIGNYTSQFRAQQDLLGSGCFGSIYIGHQIKNSKNKVAIKLISLKESSQAQVLNEVVCMLNLRSQGTLEILASQKIKFGAKAQQYYAIVTEKMNGSLRDLLEQKGKLTEAQTIEWAQKIIECYKYLQKAKVMHRDLKPDNVLYKNFGDQIVFKIGDFGLSRNYSNSKLSNKGTPFYISPQQEKQSSYTNKTDVYAFGCMLFEFLIGSKKLFGEIIDIIGIKNGSINKKDVVKVVRKVLGNIEVSEIMIQFIEGCLMYEESDRLAWKDIFDHKIFSKAIELKPNRVGALNNEHEIFPEKKLQIKDIKMQEHKINRLKITPDTTTYAWKQKKYRKDNEKTNVCIFLGVGPSQWLCSNQELGCDGEFLFTIKAVKVDKVKKWVWFGEELSCIAIGVMESSMKNKKRDKTWDHCVYLNIPSQKIYRPNEEQTNQEGIDCSCQPLPSSLPCLIECHVNLNQNTITWHYNEKDQAKSTMPNSWKDARKICAVVCIWKKENVVEFM